MKPFSINVPDAAIDDLRARLGAVRWPDEGRRDEHQGPGQRGPELSRVRDLAGRWADFDWRAAEARLNRFPQFVEEIDGVAVHFFHVRSPHEGATPIVLTHGWPGSAADFVDVVEPLTDPTAHGGAPEDAFHVVLPDIPGFGFSGKPTAGGWTIPRVAGAWSLLMERLGYERYIAQGGDLGAWITEALLTTDPAAEAAHVNFLVTPPPSDDPDVMSTLDPTSLARLESLGAFMADGSAYMALQATRPQTLAYALTDSPVGQLAWLLEKYHSWAAGPDSLTVQQILTHASIAWFTQSAGSAAHFYADNAALLPTAPVPPPAPPVQEKPFGVGVYREDPAPPIRAFAEPRYRRLVHWAEHDGGHFAPMEVPSTFVSDLRRFRAALSA
ncbi:epoxide hydrolase family protein [Isoptericola sp. 178]|uniref:epoxide hydrolase family protein n=1 Tax=Isoptericola sp. 178 TaxID=3064651 RepID=UPI002712B060|nr:epoxide hydrolase family protein [Isoptericola sp. 178]MDO8145901.1 epoxide hydrolase [Isoptericola sp. 178]